MRFELHPIGDCFGSAQELSCVAVGIGAVEKQQYNPRYSIIHTRRGLTSEVNKFRQQKAEINTGVKFLIMTAQTVPIACNMIVFQQ